MTSRPPFRPARWLRLLAAACAFAGLAGSSAAEPAKPESPLCLIMDAAARTHGLPLDFFVRIIWRESRFDADAVGPMTRRGTRALGIAQFMPATAEDEGLLDPFDPVQALPKAAGYLSRMRAEFGNLGLAAAAYNAGPRRVREWLDGSGSLPGETQRYVLAVTGRSAEEWIGKVEAPSDAAAQADCESLVASAKTSGGRFAMALNAQVGRQVAFRWGVQLAAGFSRDKALRAYERSLQRLGPLGDDQVPIITSAVLRSRGTRPFYQVRIGVENRRAGDRLCGRIRSRGIGCLVSRVRL